MSRELLTESNNLAAPKGIITERSELDFPEGATLDESNFVINRDGSRERRKGFEKEQDGQDITSVVDVSLTSGKVFKWENAGGVANNNIVVIHVNNVFTFWRPEGQTVTKELIHTYDINQGDSNGKTIVVNTTNRSRNSLKSATGYGDIFFASKSIQPFYFRYNRTTGLVDAYVIDIKVRDLIGIEDNLKIDERPAELSPEHEYNLRNQGWGFEVTYWRTSSGKDASTGDAIAKVKSIKNVYPSNADNLNVYKGGQPEDPDVVGSFNLYSMDRYNIGNTLRSRGRVIHNAFRKDYLESVLAMPKAVPLTDLSQIPTESTLERPQAITFFAGRVFYAGVSWENLNTSILFSKVTENEKDYGKCFQEADPTAEEINDLVASDGGVIVISDINSVCHLEPYQDALLVFAKNGVWAIQGSDGIFSATGYSITKLTDAGTRYSDSIIKTDNGVFYWSDYGIHIIGSTDATSSYLGVTNLSVTTIQQLYNNISETSKLYSQVAYNYREKRIYWAYHNNIASVVDSEKPIRKNAFLIYDIPLGAFYKWDTDDSQVWFTSPFINFDSTTSVVDFAVYVGEELVVVD